MVEKAMDKIKGATLNRLEHNIISLLQNGTAPLYSIYADMSIDMDGVDIGVVWSALGKLLNSGFVTAVRVEDSRRVNVAKLTAGELRQYTKWRSEEDLKGYPLGTEYELSITLKGAEEESKDIYNDYYDED